MDHLSSASPSCSTVPNALCFNAESPATGLPCHVAVTGTGLTVRFEDTKALGELSLPFSAFSVSAGGLNHDQLVVRWGVAPNAHTLYLKDPAFIRSFRSVAPPELMKQLDATAANVRRVRSRNRTIWGLLAGVIGGLALGLWFGTDFLVQSAVGRIPVEWEQRLGEAAYRDFLLQHTVVKDGPAVAAVHEISQRLIGHIPDNPYRFDISVVESDVVNAFALPGGYVIVFSALIQKAENAEEVAGVLSHEFSHVLKRHALERIVKQLGVVAVLGIILGGEQGLAGLMKHIGAELLSLRFSRSQETEADVTGLHLLHLARIDPSGMVTFFERLSEKERGGIEWLSTHPMSTGRAERLRTEMAGLPNTVPEPFTFQWKTVQNTPGAVAAPQ
jgi:beta-barrel assembly-enhancing protease